MKQKFLCLLLALTLVLGLAATVSADEEFLTSGDWTYRVVRGTAMLITYNGTDTEVTVPATIDGIPVSDLGIGLGGTAFEAVADTMTSVTIEDGIPILNAGVFKGCTALTEVNIPSSVTYIGSVAFQDCTALKEIELKEGLTSVGMFTFLNTGLTSVLIPSTVTDIGEEAFGFSGTMGDSQYIDDFTIYGYTGTAAQKYAQDWHFNFVDLGGNYDNSGRCGDALHWEYTAATGTLRIYGPGGYMYDYDEDEIPWLIHKPCITNVVIENGVEICSYAFQGCSNLTTVTMADSVVDIHGAAFMNTPKLTSIQLPASLEYIGSHVFCDSGLTSIKLPDSLRDIGPEAFRNTALTAIEIPDSVTSISQGAFFNCVNLASAKLPAALEDLGNQVFQDCTSLTSIDLPETLLYIGRQAFCGSGLTSIEIPDNVVLIDENAFCCNLELKYVKLPASLEEMGWRCFSECPKLSTIVMPEGITTNFGQWCFLDCDSLTDLSFHTSPIIGMAMYTGCDGLTDLTIPACVTTISDRAFDYCYQLSSVTIPESVTSIGVSAFSHCPKLPAITFLGDAPAFHDYAFQETTITCFYPAGNTTWTEDVMQQYGGNVRWCAYDPELFLDVAVDEFYYDSVVWAVENGITTGISPDRFGPNEVCLRSQVVTFLWRAAGEPIVEFENPFVDVRPSDYYYNAVLWAVSEGITNGIDSTHFRPNDTCNRSQVVTFLHRAAGEPIVRADNPFTDVKTTDYYYDAVLWAAKNGVTNGITPSTFVPFQTCNRSQIVTFLYRSDNIPEPEIHAFELLNSDPTEETGYVFCEGTEFAAGESVIFYAEPWYGYLVQFEVNADTIELYYLGGNYYEFIMPDQDVVMTAHFVPATGDYHHINMDFTNGIAVANCLTDEDGRDIAKAQEFVQLYIVPDEGFSFSEDCITITSNGQPLDFWWYLGSTEDPDIGTVCIVELLMPDGDVDISITCTPGTSPAAAGSTRIPVSVN